MIFEKIVINNFGPFYGKQELKIALQGLKNITMVLGQNQVGKTSLLRAVIWCFYGKLIEDDAGQTVSVLNNQAENELIYKASVLIRFSVEHSQGSSNYEILRFYEKKFIGGAKKPTETINSKLTLIDSSGHRKDLLSDEAELFLKRHAPKDLYKYFFIKGENFAFMQNNISEPIKELLGINRIDLLIDIIKQQKKEYEKEIRNNTSNLEAGQLQKNIDAKNEKLEKLRQKDLDYKEEIEKLSNSLSDLSLERDQLFDQSQADGRLQQLNRNFIEKKQELEKHEKEFKDWFGDSLLSLVSRRLANAPFMTIETLDQESDKKNEGITVPTPYKEIFIADILKNNECICGRALDVGSIYYKRVESLKEKGSNAYVEQIFQTLRAYINILATDLHEAKNRNFRKINENLRTVHSQIELQNNQISDLTKKTEGFNREKFKTIEETVLQAQRSKFSYTGEKRDNLKIIGTLEGEISDLSRNLVELVRKNSSLEKATKRSGYIRQLVEYLENEKDVILEKCRNGIESQVNKILNESLAQAPKVTVNRNFTYSLGETGIAGGPKRVIDLAFTASILNINKAGALRGVIIPLMADATFGEVDEDYRKAISKFLPDMAPQLIVLLSGTQAYAFLERIQPKIGRLYILKRFYKHEPFNESEGEIIFNRKKIKTKIFNQEKQYTEICEEHNV